MTWFRVGGAGIPAALKNAMNAVFNKKFGTTGQNYPPNQWPDDVNLLGPLPEGTASGPIANISDGADQVPIKLWNSNVDASVDGVSEVECKQTGKNLFDYEAVQAFNANVIITRSDGDYTMQNNNSYAVGAFRGIQFHLKPATYSLSIGEAITVPIRIYKNGSWFNNGINAGNTSCTFTVSEEADYDFSCNVAANSSLTIKKCQFEVGSAATAYEAYEAPTMYTVSLGRTIHGGSLEFISGAGTDENGVNFTFAPISPIPETENVCNFWTDVGSSSIVYRRDIDLALQAVSSSRGLMMASRPVMQLVGEESDPDQVNELVEDDENDIPEQLNEVVENDETEQEGENDAR